ncbi:MAG: sugar transferase [Mycobacterium sp.]
MNTAYDAAANVVPPQRKPQRWHLEYSRRLVALDTVAVVVAVGTAQWLRFGALSGTPHAYRASHYTLVSVFIVMCLLSALAIYRTRSPRIIGSGAEEYRRIWVATLFTFGGVAILSVIFKFDLARGYLMIALPLGVFLLILGRWTARRMVAGARKTHGRCITRLLVVGSASAVRDLTKALSREAKSEYQVVGACVPGFHSRKAIDVPGVGTIPTFGDETHVVEAIQATSSDSVAVTATERLDGRGMRDLSWELEKLDVHLMVAPSLFDVAGPRLMMRPVAGLPLIHVEKPQYNGASRFQKRLFDMLFASAVLVCGFPLLLAVAIAIKATSRGPTFYKSERIGLDGQPFDMVKFRTMVDGADTMVDSLTAQNESDGGVLFKIRSDPRVTPVGRFLRKYSIDELPQFINVLKHDMSVVGPRPSLAREVKTYDDHVKRRLLVRPGITGLWQVSGRSDLSWEESVRLDLFYVENWSTIGDLIIALKTVKAVLGGSGAY